MADKFTKTEEPRGVFADDWKNVQVEKEHQPEKVTSHRYYRDMESELEQLNADITRLGVEKTDLEAEMVKVKAAVEA